MQWASVNMLYQKRYKTDIFNKSAFANRAIRERQTDQSNRKREKKG